ncbi:MAG: thiamine phosphate synthase [Croceibacterium sp.]
MDARQTFARLMPALWVLTDARNDAALEHALAHLPPGSGLVFRHYHLRGTERRARFDALAWLARAKGHWVFLAGSPATARRWGADGVYGAPTRVAGGHGLLRLATAHSLRELGAAGRAGADAVMLSPVFPTRSHPGGKTLGPLRFRLLAAHSPVPVIALGGMNARTANRLAWPHWAAIDGRAAQR